MAASQAVASKTRVPESKTDAGRLLSLDAFRGITMVLMLSEGFGLGVFSESPILGALARQLDHQEWHGMNVWDLIQPFFMFIVGVAIPFSFAKRWEKGESWQDSLIHVLKRCALLIFWGLVARSLPSAKPNFDVINVLAQVSVGYLIAFLILRKSYLVQGLTAAALLIATWLIYQFAAAPGVQGPWVRDANIGWYLDGLLFHKHWGGSYATLNCIPSAANVIFGLMAGKLLHSTVSPARKIRSLLAYGAVGVVVGLALDPVIPIIKKIWTPSFALYSAGYTLWTLAFFYWICDIKQKRTWAQLFVIVGSNSIFIYLFHEILHRWMNQTAHGMTAWASGWLGPWQEVVAICSVLVFEIYVCYWLYQRRIFFKL